MCDHSEDMRWAMRLEGISTSHALTDPANTHVFAVTRLLLEAGLQVKEKEFAVGEGGATHGMSRVTRSLVTKRARAIKAARRLDLGEMSKSLVGAFNSRWPQIDRYRKDLVIFELYSLRWREALEVSRHHMLRVSEEVIAGRRSGLDLVRETVLKDAHVRSRFMRLSINQASLVADPVYRDLACRAHSEFLAAHHDDWVVDYESIRRKFDIELRSDISTSDLSKWIAWMVRAAAWEANVTGTDRSALAIRGILTLVAGAVDPGDHHSVEEVIGQVLAAPTAAVSG